MLQDPLMAEFAQVVDGIGSAGLTFIPGPDQGGVFTQLGGSADQFLHGIVMFGYNKNFA